ncbi:alpha/beta hydrolase [Kocuria rhizophila]|uniref:alpha/beta hydrolase n=1 Tax=Kocuria rhizophila TaxID=72000 RepID=UPI0039819848
MGADQELTGDAGQEPGVRRRRARRWLVVAARALAAVLALAVGGLPLWSGTGVMSAEPEPWEGVQHDPAIRVEQRDSAVVLHPARPVGTQRGLVFCPGAKVDPEACAARLSGLVAEEGMTVGIPDPWLHLALFDRRDVTAFTAEAPQVNDWFVGGHSMGGVRACRLAPESEGLLLGSYCATVRRPLVALPDPVSRVGHVRRGPEPGDRTAQLKPAPPSAVSETR